MVIKRYAMESPVLLWGVASWQREFGYFKVTSMRGGHDWCQRLFTVKITIVKCSRIMLKKIKTEFEDLMLKKTEGRMIEQLMVGMV